VRRLDRDAAERFANRRQAEDDAPRLLRIAPTLTDLRLELKETRTGVCSPVNTYARPVLVTRAPALFVLPCTDSACRGGGHDVTSSILRRLAARDKDFEGEDVCRGTIGTADCGRVLHFRALATYAG
jgi:hypothetical protein